MIWHSILGFLGISASPPVEPQRIEIMTNLHAWREGHSADTRKVEASALSRVVQAESDPNRKEMKRLNIERRKAVDAAFNGHEPLQTDEANDIRALTASVLDRRHRT